MFQCKKWVFFYFYVLLLLLLFLVKYWSSHGIHVHHLLLYIVLRMTVPINRWVQMVCCFSKFHLFKVLILLQSRAKEYSSTSQIFKGSPPFRNWLLKPVNFEAFSINTKWGMYCTIAIDYVISEIKLGDLACGLIDYVLKFSKLDIGSW